MKNILAFVLIIVSATVNAQDLSLYQKKEYKYMTSPRTV